MFYLRCREKHESGAFQYGPCRAHLRPPPLIFQVVLSVTGDVGKVHHLAPELAERFHELGEIVDALQARQRVGHLGERTRQRERERGHR